MRTVGKVKLAGTEPSPIDNRAYANVWSLNTVGAPDVAERPRMSNRIRPYNSKVVSKFGLNSQASKSAKDNRAAEEAALRSTINKIKETGPSPWAALLVSVPSQHRKHITSILDISKKEFFNNDC